MLKLRRIGIDARHENVAFLARNCSQYRPEEFEALEKVEIAANGKRILAILNVVDDFSLLGPDEVGLGERAFRHFAQPEGTLVEIAQASPPHSLDAVRRKARGQPLSGGDIEAIIRDIAANRYSKAEITAFLIASASFMTTDEVLALTRSMAKVGNRLKWEGPLIVDKHCIGGIPGNRTSMIVVPIVAAHGLKIPKTSSRAITSPAGTADTMEILARVDLSIEEMQKLVEHENGCLVWGGHVDLSPADDILISVERPLGLDPREQMVASILSKKLAAGSTHLVVDIPVGPTAKVRDHTDAARLKKLFEYIGGEIGLTLDVVITDGSQPVGRGVGPALEARDVMKVLRNESDAPADLRERALLLAGHVLDFDPNMRGGDGHRRAADLLDSGAALARMERIVAGQGRNERSYPLGHLTLEIHAPIEGRVEAIDCYRIARVARLAGAPTDKGAGVDLMKKIGDPVREGEALYRIHACVPADFRFASEYAAAANGYTIAGTW